MKAIVIYLTLGWAMAPVISWIEKYVFSDWEFLKFLFVIVSVDTALGLFKAIRQRQVSSKGFGMVLRKIIIYTSALVATSALTKFTVSGAPQVAFSFLGNVVFSAIMVREAISIFENIAEIDPGVLPGWILKYLQKFDSLTGKKLTDEN
ncbi:phage holin family protein [Chitinophaga tropicalis]|uniref:Holin n=1 Tax=Chitinophaga tropicalis TaxID=2683588 RepID=A0A7K1UAT6_9BACT|nr:phage holin family protein [Chitinophaga tropicalis]MVT11388.1 holin [Chitinophaga tropicalis]